MLLQLSIWLIPSHKPGKPSALHATPKMDPQTFPQEKYNISHVIQIYPGINYMAIFPLLFIRGDIVKKSRFVPTYPPLIKANSCLASRLIFSNLYESAFSAIPDFLKISLLIHSSVTPSPFFTWVLTSEKGFKKKNTFNLFSEE